MKSLPVFSLLLAASQAGAITRCIVNGTASFSDTKCIDRDSAKVASTQITTSDANPVTRGNALCRNGLSKFFSYVGQVSGGKIEIGTKPARNYLVPVRNLNALGDYSDEKSYACFTSIDGDRLVKIMAIGSPRPIQSKNILNEYHE